MKKILSFLSILLLTASLFAGAQNSNAAKFKFNEEIHNFGNIKQGESVTCVFEFTNVGKEPLIITGCNAQCGCTVPTWDKKPILPGSKGEINVKFDTAGKSGSFIKEIYIQSNAAPASPGQERYTIKIQGNITN
jgi:hypothetical protein